MSGSLINRLIERGPITVPAVGDGATLLSWSDRSPYTVRSVKVSPSGKTIVITATEDKATRTDNNGLSESQTYTFEPDDAAAPETFKSVSGKPFRRVYWSNEEDGFRLSDTVLRVGHRDKYRDPSF